MVYAVKFEREFHRWNIDVELGIVAKFVRAIAGVLYYKVEVDGGAYEFPVDMNDKEDVGTATFDAEIKAITLMRYIRKADVNTTCPRCSHRAAGSPKH
jgi:hypothetical protein